MWISILFAVFVLLCDSVLCSLCSIVWISAFQSFFLSYESVLCSTCSVLWISALQFCPLNQCFASLCSVWFTMLYSLCSVMWICALLSLFCHVNWCFAVFVLSGESVLCCLCSVIWISALQIFVLSCESVLCLGFVCRSGVKTDVSAMLEPYCCVSLAQRWAASHHASLLAFHNCSCCVLQAFSLSHAEAIGPQTVSWGAEVLQRLGAKPLLERSPGRFL